MPKALALAALTLPFIPGESLAQFRALNYDTPSYIEMELGEIRAYEGTTTVSINLFRTGEFRVITRVDYTTIEQSASEGSDFKASGGTLVFQPGEGFKTITLELLTDDELEPDETFALKLSAQSEHVLITRDTATITIQDPPAAISTVPALKIAPLGSGEVRLSWTGSSAAVLERAPSPASTQWEAFPCTVQTIGSECEVVQPAGDQLYFYRLRMD